jgi:hypothetical protein
LRQGAIDELAAERASISLLAVRARGVRNVRYQCSILRARRGILRSLENVVRRFATRQVDRAPEGEARLLDRAVTDSARRNAAPECDAHDEKEDDDTDHAQL